MVISSAVITLELPESYSLKDKRREIKSLISRVQQKFKVSIAEIELNDSIRFSALGVAFVSNSTQFGQKVIQKVHLFLEDNVNGHIVSFESNNESYG